MYDINYETIKKGKNFYYLLIVIASIGLIGFIYFFFYGKEAIQNAKLYTIGIIIFIIILIISFIASIIKINKRVKKIEELSKYAKLVKGMPYTLEPSGMKKNGYIIMRPVIYYTLPNGKEEKLKGDPRHDGKIKDETGLIDLIIDELHPEKNFMDFNINRIGGNKDEDYYHASQDEIDRTKRNILQAEENIRIEKERYDKMREEEERREKDNF